MSASSNPLVLAAFASPTKSSRTAAIIRDAVNAGKPLPLAVMLESMWRWRDEAVRLEDPKSLDHDPLAARQCRVMAMTAAEKAAPYVHPRQANITVRPEDELEASERRSLARSIAEQMEGKSVTELGRLWLSVSRGERHESDEPRAGSDATGEGDEAHGEGPEGHENGTSGGAESTVVVGPVRGREDS